MAYRHVTGLDKGDSGSLSKRKPNRQYLMYYVMLCVDCNVLYVHIGCVQSAITSSMYVSHAAAPSAWLDSVLKCLESRSQTVSRLATETVA